MCNCVILFGETGSGKINCLRKKDMENILVFTSDEIASPMVCGLRNPRIFLPSRMDFQDRVLLRSIFAHETMHIRRKDNWMKVFMLALMFSVLFPARSGVVFATGGQAPFSPALTSYCAGSNSRWGVKAFITRDIAMGEDAGKRADNAVFSVLEKDVSKDPDVIKEAVREALAEEFGVEKGAFGVDVSLCLSREELEKEYAEWDLRRSRRVLALSGGEDTVL